MSENEKTITMKEAGKAVVERDGGARTLLELASHASYLSSLSIDLVHARVDADEKELEDTIENLESAPEEKVLQVVKAAELTRLFIRELAAVSIYVQAAIEASQGGLAREGYEKQLQKLSKLFVKEAEAKKASEGDKTE